MLPAAARLRDPSQFRSIVRHGVRVGRPTLVVHADLAEHASRDDRAGSCSAKVGFVVSKKVGNAVVRNRVKRRLRHLALNRLRLMASGHEGHSTESDASSGPVVGLRVVVRALPAAATEPSRLPEDLASAWDRALVRLSRRQATGDQADAETHHGEPAQAGLSR